MNRSLIIFAGAGASRGVSREKYPTAVDFKQKLPVEVTSQALYKELDRYLQKQVVGTVDIEHVLWELGRLIEIVDELVDPSRFTARLLTTNEIAPITGQQHHGPHTHSQLNRLAEVARDLQNRINKNIYDFYSQEPSAEELSKSWKPLLEWAARDFSRVDIATTNYDLVLEHVLRNVPSLRVSNGAAAEVLPRIDLGRWDGEAQGDDGLLTKLHGSVDWKIGNGGSTERPVIRYGLPEFEGDHDKRLILYPGFKGRPSRQPFIAFHEYFKQRVGKATHLLFIGFAFRDEFINELIAMSVQPSTRIAVVDPVPNLPNLSFLSKAKHLAQGFGTQSVGIDSFSLNDVEDWAR